MAFFSDPIRKALSKCLFLFILSAISFEALAQPAGWQHKLAIRIANSNQATVNFQQMLLIDTKSMVDAGKLSASMKDLRFGKDPNGNILFPYFIESGANTASTKVWVKLDHVPANGILEFYMFYGNNSAVSASTLLAFEGPFNTTDSTTEKQVGSPAINSQRGIWFRPKQSILLTGLGKQMPVASTNTVTLFDLDTEDILEQTSVGGAAEQFNYTSLSNYRWLNKGSDYVVELFIPSGSYYQANLLKVNKYLSIPRMVFCNGCDASTLPDPTSNATSFAGFNGGYADMQFYVRNDSIDMPAYTFGPFLETLTDTLKHAVYGNDYSDTVRATGGVTPYSYEVLSGSLPSGFTLSTAGILKGTPTQTGSFNLTVKVTDASGTAAFASKNYTLTIKPQPLTITADNKTKVYGDNMPLLTTTYDGLVNGELSVPGVTVTTSADKSSNVGEYMIAVSSGASTNYTITYKAGKLIVNPRNLSFSLNASPAITKIYDGKDTAILNTGNFSLNNVVAGDNITVGCTTRYSDKSVGNNKIISATNLVLNGTAKNNYQLLTSSATTTGNITARPVSVSLLSTPAITKIYDGNDNASIASGNYTVSGILAGDDAILNKPVAGLYDSRHAGEGKTVTVSGLQLQGTHANNYALSSTTASANIGSIQKKGVNITAQAASKTYGASDPVLSSQISGLIGNDDLMSILERDPGENVGNYSIRLKSIGNEDYKIDDYTQADLTINKAEIIVTANDKIRDQGQANPEFTVTYKGFVRGEDASVFTQPVQITTTANQSSPFGYYDIIPSGAAAANYRFTYVKGRLNILSSSGTARVWAINRNNIQVHISSSRSQKVTIQIFSETGHRILSQQNTLTIGSNGIVLRVSPLAAAFYIVKIDGENFKETHKISVR